MASSVEDDFDSWLSLKLQELNTDEGVFGSYIKGILDGDESLEEKTEALEGILTEITEADIGKHCREIVDRWNSSQLIVSCSTAMAGEGKEGSTMVDDVEQKLVKLLETNAPSTLPQREYTDEERRIRQAILAQYSQTSDKDSDDEGGGGGAGGGGGVSSSDGVGGGGGGGGGKGKENFLFRNTNAATVQQAEKEKREKAKLDSQKKKEKDKEDREKQKQLQQEKKEKRKTQKGERRR